MDSKFDCEKNFGPLPAYSKSESYLTIEKRIEEEHKRSFRQVLYWSLRHPIQAARIYRSLKARENSSEEVIQKWRSFSSFRNYNEQYGRLLAYEIENGYPTLKHYGEILDHLAQRMPLNLLQNAYYPFAGTDFYWARIFKNIIFEDVAYGESRHPNMWWSDEQYGGENLNSIEKLLRDQEIIPAEALVEMRRANSELRNEGQVVNSQEWTLILKGGHDVLSFFKERHSNESVLYGAVIAVSPANSEKNLREGMDLLGYQLHYSSLGAESFVAPFSMEFSKVFIFVKNDK